MFERIGFIGAGNMGGAVARAIYKSGHAKEIYLSNRSPAKAQTLANEIGGIATSNELVARTSNLIFLGVKPPMMQTVLNEISIVLRNRKDNFVLVTMAAGLSCQRIQEMMGATFPVIRIMPNTPCAVGSGVVQYCARGTTEKELEAFAKLMAPAGVVDLVDESMIDAASAVSGCGPAFAYQFIEALADGAVACGLPRDKAMTYAAQMVVGAGQMVLQSGKHPGALKDAVCSPGGTTIQGVRKLEEGGFRAAAMNAVIAAYEKTLTIK